MKLNHDCVRAVLITLESLQPDEYLDYDDPHEFENLAGFNIYETQYAIEKMIEAGLVNAMDMSTLSGRSYMVQSITWSGHQYLDNIRDDGIWKQTKETASKIAGASLSIMVELASSYVKKKLGLG